MQHSTINTSHNLPCHPESNSPSLEADYEAARRLHKKHGTSYYFATRLFPKEMRQATFALYAFFRVPDEMVDNSTSPTEAREQLGAWCEQWERAYATGEADHPVLRVAAHTFHQYHIPHCYGQAFLDAMRRDLTDTRYNTYADLESYMYGSAAVVGLMMAHVIGFSDESALPYAEKLGYAMQLTNFLRDIDEDFQDRGRIYLPLDEMAQFGVTPEQIAERRFDEAFRALMTFQTERADTLFEEANQGIHLLTPSGQRAVRVASALYRAILTKLAQQDNNPFVGRARTSRWEKIALAYRVWQK
jgi:15-cis-phytoene synthase